MGWLFYRLGRKRSEVVLNAAQPTYIALTVTRSHECVALKVSVSNCEKESREATVLRTIASAGSHHPGRAHLISMTDLFKLQGPNGSHHCFALDMMGPSVPDVLERKFGDQRLPGRLAKSIARQALLGLDYLHQQGIAHGGLSLIRDWSRHTKSPRSPFP
jgi:serine/threonine-protein kinase SRPK3